MNLVAGSINLAVSVKITVHFGLYCKTIMNLGTQKHQIYVNRGFLLKDLGCFMMTEMGHGSNVNGIITNAHYIHNKRAFIINTPHNLGTKYWIGNLGRTANKGVVFANLVINGKNFGIHVFLVNIRDCKGRILKGLEIGDCGHKMGFNGVDNGWCIFNNVEIPYDNLLDKFG